MEDVLGIADIDFDEIARITGEDKNTAIEKTLNAWAGSFDYRKRRQAVLDGGPVQWKLLLHDKSVYVRAAIVEKGTEKYQLALVGDTEPVIRDWLARYGTEKVRQSLIEAGERDQSVIASIASHGGVEIRKALVSVCWDKPDYLVRIMPYAVNSDLKRLTDHPNKDVRVAAASYGSKEMCLKVLADKDLGIARFFLEERISDLDDMAERLHIRGRERSEVNQEREREPELS